MKKVDPFEALDKGSSFFVKIFDIIKSIWPVGLAVLLFLLIGTWINGFVALIGFVLFIGVLIYIYNKLKQ